MSVSQDVILRLAEMARVGLTPEEADRLTGQMGAILDHVSRLQEVDTTGIDPDLHAATIVDATRPDQILPSLSVDEVLANAPEQHDGFFVVPAIFGE